MARGSPPPPCSVCGESFKLNKDGSVRRHRYPQTQEPCPGSRQPPKAGSWKPIETLPGTWKWIPEGNSYEEW